MKVLHVTNAWPSKDYQAYGIFIKEQVDALERQGIICDVIFIDAREKGKREYLQSMKYIKKANKEFKPDIIHFHHQFSLLPNLTWVKRPVVLSLLGDISKRSILNRLIFSMVKSKVDILIQKVIATDGSGKEVYLPNGVNLSEFHPMDRAKARQKLGLNPLKKYGLFVAADLTNPIKRYDLFVKVIDILNKGKLDVEALVMTKVDRADVPTYYSAADFFLLCSSHEGSPNALKEAMACNLPVVSAEVGNVKYMVDQLPGNYCVNTSDPEILAQYCLKAMSENMKNGRNRLIELGLDNISVAEKLISVYNRLLR